MYDIIYTHNYVDVAFTGIFRVTVESLIGEHTVAYLDSFDINKSTGTDSVSPRLIKEFKQQMLKPLTTIFNHSVQGKKYPMTGSWRT